MPVVQIAGLCILGSAPLAGLVLSSLLSCSFLCYPMPECSEPLPCSSLKDHAHLPFNGSFSPQASPRPNPLLCFSPRM